MTASGNDAPLHVDGTPRSRTTHDTVAGIAWTTLALVALLSIPWMLETTTPVFQLLWLVVPLVHLLRYRDASAVGLTTLDLRRFLGVSLAAGATYAALVVAVEPWVGVYDRLVELALAGPDPTFAWLVRFDGPIAWIGLLLFSGFVTLYSEELFFRGWLLRVLERRTRPGVAVVAQALVFMAFQALPVLFFSPVQAVFYLTVYAFGLGLVVGLAAHRTGSILPGLAVVTVANFALTFLLV
jgi:membrane protease YdiL (CAAX protease family)